MTTNNHIIIGDISPRIQYTADGKQKEFIYPFPIFEDNDLEVFIGDERQVRGFTLTGAGESQGGTLTFTRPPPAQAIVTLRRHVPVKRTTDFQEGGAFRAKVINDELDRMTAQIQQIEVEASRGLKLSPSDAVEGLTLPPAATRKGKLLGFDPQGRPVAEATPGAVMAADQRAKDAETARDQANTASRQANQYRTQAQTAQKDAETARDETQAALRNAHNANKATKTEARAGSNNSKIMTPLRVKQAIDGLRPKMRPRLAVFNAPGTHQWTVPNDVKWAVVEVWGAGGGGTGGTGGAGHGGGYTRKIVALTPGGEVPVTIGRGGTGNVIHPVGGGLGGTSSFGTHCSATGGQRSYGGRGFGGHINYQGGSGDDLSGQDNLARGGHGAGGGGSGGQAWGGNASGMHPGGGGNAHKTGSGNGANGQVIVHYWI